MEQFNPGLKNLVNLGKSYEKAVMGKHKSLNFLMHAFSNANIQCCAIGIFIVQLHYESKLIWVILYSSIT